MLCRDVGDSGVTKKLLCIDKALLQIGGAVGFQAVDSVHNSLIAVISGNIHPSTRYRCAVGKGNQSDKATRALAITIKEIDGRSLGGSQTVFAISAATAIKDTRR